MEENNVIKPAVKKTSRKRPSKKAEVKQPVIEIEVDDEPIVLDDRQEEVKPEIKQVVKAEVPEIKHEYDDKVGKFTAEKDNGEKLEMFTPTVLPSEYCVIVRKFLSVNNGVSIGKYSVGTHKTVDYGELDNVKPNTLESIHCYNIVSECGVDMLRTAISKLKPGGKCFIVESSRDLTKVITKLKDINVRFCGYGFRLFNHNYWHNHKNMSIALIMKG